MGDAMEKVPIGLITIFHPEHWLQTAISDLKHIPHIKKDRKRIEEVRRSSAEAKGIEYNTAWFHERLIGNTGESIDRFRRTWLEVPELTGVVRCLEALEPALCIYDGERGQSRFRIECRYDWGEKANMVLDAAASRRVRDRIIRDSKISIRQLWLNPTAARFGTLALPAQVTASRSMANLMLGPFSQKDAQRREVVDLIVENGVCWVRFDR